MNVTLLATAWGPKHGGINAFNENFAVALADRLKPNGAVFCAVSDPDADVAAAKQRGVTLIPITGKGASDRMDPSWVHDIQKWFKDKGGVPAGMCWVGHDVLSGDIALEAAKSLGGTSALFKHMSYIAYQSAKSRNSVDADDKHSRQRTLFRAASSSHLFAVGPVLRKAAQALAGAGPTVRELVPGFPEQATQRSRDDLLSAITFGRMDATEDRIKQGRLAAAGFGCAIRQADQQTTEVPSLATPRLTLIGLAADGSEEEEVRKIVEEQANKVVVVHALPYDTDRQALYERLAEANLALMLSWHEGFGLTGWEAIGYEVPLILGRNTGLHELIRERLGDPGLACVKVVNVKGSADPKQAFHPQDLQDVERAVIQVASELPRWKTNARALKAMLETKCPGGWSQAADTFIAQVFNTGSGSSAPPSCAGTGAHNAVAAEPALRASPGPALASVARPSDDGLNLVVYRHPPQFTEDVPEELRRTLHSEYLRSHRWAEALLKQILCRDSILAEQLGMTDDFFRPFRDALTLGNSSSQPPRCAIIGRSGAGKSVQVAKAVVAAAAHKDTSGLIPILLPDSELDGQDLEGSLARRFGLTSDGRGLLAGMPDSVRSRLVFISDALEHARDLDAAAKALRRLAGRAALLITCREGQWPQANLSLRLSGKEIIKLKPLDQAAVAGVLRWTPEEVAARPFLLSRAILDLFLHLYPDPASGQPARAENAASLLRAFRARAVAGSGGRSNAELMRVLDAIALAQLQLGTFEVPSHELRARLEDVGDSSIIKALQHLEEKKILASRAGPAESVRLRHDLFDTFSIGDLVLRDRPLFDDLWKLMHIGFGQLACEGYVGAALGTDREREILIEIFNRFLHSVESSDRKQDENPALAWNSGYVIDRYLDQFAPHIYNVIGITDLVEPPPKGSDRAVSRLGSSSHVPVLTQPALSSVVGRLAEASERLSRPPQDPLAGTLLSRIATLIDNPCVELKARLIEAVPAAGAGDGALDLLSNLLARHTAPISLTDPSHDPEILVFIARALAKVRYFPSGSDKERRDAEHLLDMLASTAEDMANRHGGAWLVVRRVAQELQQSSLLPQLAEASTRRSPVGRSPFTPEELEVALPLTSPRNPKQARDWTIIRDYCEWLHVRVRGLDESVYEKAVERLSALLWHAHERSNTEAAEALGAFTRDPRARGALLEALSLNANERTTQACLRSLSSLVPADTKERERFRLAVLRASVVRHAIGAPAIDSLIGELLADRPAPGSALVTAGFVGLRSIPGAELVELPQEPEAGLEDATVGWMDEADKQEPVGKEDKGPKRTFTLDPAEPGFSLLGSRWVWSKRLHNAMIRKLWPKPVKGGLPEQGSLPVTASALKDTLIPALRKPEHAHLSERRARTVGDLYKRFEGSGAYPGIASVHVTLLSDQGRVVVEAQRADNEFSYWRKAWAPGFEEGIEKGDGTIRDCVLRGLKEEYGPGIFDLFSREEVRIGDAWFGVEWWLSNFALLLPVYLPVGGHAVIEQGRRYAQELLAEGKKKPELVDWRLRSLDELAREFMQTSAGGWLDLRKEDPSAPFHPTSAARIGMVLGCRAVGLEGA
jgi:hypothetical protein